MSNRFSQGNCAILSMQALIKPNRNHIDAVHSKYGPYGLVVNVRIHFKMLITYNARSIEIMMMMVRMMICLIR